LQVSYRDGTMETASPTLLSFLQCAPNYLHSSTQAPDGNSRGSAWQKGEAGGRRKRVDRRLTAAMIRRWRKRVRGAARQIPTSAVGDPDNSAANERRREGFKGDPQIVSYIF
jgi:hypothetical protein